MVNYTGFNGTDLKFAVFNQIMPCFLDQRRFSFGEKNEVWGQSIKVQNVNIYKLDQEWIAFFTSGPKSISTKLGRSKTLNI